MGGWAGLLWDGGRGQGRRLVGGRGYQGEWAWLFKTRLVRSRHLPAAVLRPGTAHAQIGQARTSGRLPQACSWGVWRCHGALAWGGTGKATCGVAAGWTEACRGDAQAHARPALSPGHVL